MPINTLADYSAKCAAIQCKGTFGDGWGNGSNGGSMGSYPLSLYQKIQQGGANSVVLPPNSAGSEVLNQNSNGALLKLDRVPATSSKKMWLAEVEWTYITAGTGAPRNHVLIVDRLVHTVGMSTLAGAGVEQTVNLPTPPLPRYTDGEGVMMAIECWATSTSSSTGNLITVRYTNSKGEPNRISQPVAHMVSNVTGAIGICVIVPLQDGDTGVRSVEGVTMSEAGSTGGNFGVTLFKQLAFSAMDNAAQVERTTYRNYLSGGALVEVMPGACLSLLMFNGQGSTSSHYYSGRVGIITE